MEVRRSEELAGVVRALYAAMGAGDPDAVEAFYSLAPHAVFLGSDRAEFWTDSARHNLDVRPYWEQAGNTVTPAELLAFECGDVGWTVDRPTIELAAVQRFETRLTFVFHREDGAWKVVHAHTSVGVEPPG
jgi:ketosteroid isomerase-like protein